jgi:hypothetical protein
MARSNASSAYFFGLSGSDHVQADGFAHLHVLTAYSTIGQVVQFTECGHRQHLRQASPAGPKGNRHGDQFELIGLRMWST